MRTEKEMLDLIVGTAKGDERIRAVILNGSRSDPRAPPDIFQDFDIVYVVTDVDGFKHGYNWIRRFGEIMVMQMPEDMQDPPPTRDGGFVYLMQFADGNRIDLSICPLSNLHRAEKDGMRRLLLDRDGISESFAPSSDRGYLPRPPSAKAFADCCNEFWWVCPYVAKGLWREEVIYAKHMLDRAVRDQLMKMVTWYAGMNTEFSINLGNLSKRLREHLEPELWALLEKTYSDACLGNAWEALFVMCGLFSLTANRVAGHFGFGYPRGDEQKVTAHLRHVRQLPRNATEMY